MTIEDLRGFDAVVHLAELSNDPVGELNPDITFEINHLGSVRLATARQGGRRRSASSTCRRAASTAPPATAFSTEVLRAPAAHRVRASARCSSSRTCDRWPTTASRRRSCATPRRTARRRGSGSTSSSTTSPAMPGPRRSSGWRATGSRGGRSSTSSTSARRSTASSRRPRDVIHGEIFNVGSNDQNYQIRTIAEIIADTFPDCRSSIGSIERPSQLPGGLLARSTSGCRASSAAGMSPAAPSSCSTCSGRSTWTTDLFAFRGHTRIKQIKHLLATQPDRRPPVLARPTRSGGRLALPAADDVDPVVDDLDGRDRDDEPSTPLAHVRMLRRDLIAEVPGQDQHVVGLRLPDAFWREDRDVCPGRVSAVLVWVPIDQVVDEVRAGCRSSSTACCPCPVPHSRPPMARTRRASMRKASRSRFVASALGSETGIAGHVPVPGIELAAPEIVEPGRRGPRSSSAWTTKYRSEPPWVGQLLHIEDAQAVAGQHPLRTDERVVHEVFVVDRVELVALDESNEVGDFDRQQSVRPRAAAQGRP